MTSLLRWRQPASLRRWRPRASPAEADASKGLRDLSEQYSLLLREYCADRDEAVLFRAYELGRRAASEGLGVLEMAAMHQDALMSALLDVDDVQENTLIVESACELFAECLAPFELSRRVYQDRARAAPRSAS